VADLNAKLAIAVYTFVNKRKCERDRERNIQNFLGQRVRGFGLVVNELPGKF
jgi:hypothetical protein